MTASHVDGVEVIAVENAKSNWKGRNGEHLEYRQMLKLLLADGRELYGCLHCDYTHENLNSIRPHLNKHRLPDLGNGLAGLDIPGLIKRLSDVDRVETERDRWKTRALDAERELRKIRQAFKGLA